MDATLDAEWVLEWARFCIEFVDEFKDYDVYGSPFLGAPTADIGLERLRHVQVDPPQVRRLPEGLEGLEALSVDSEPYAEKISVCHSVPATSSFISMKRIDTSRN
eukprot:1622884-Rhodomonas_salina.3